MLPSVLLLAGTFGHLNNLRALIWSLLAPQMQALSPDIIMLLHTGASVACCQLLACAGRELGCSMLSVQMSSMQDLTVLRRELVDIIECIEHQDSAQASHSDAL